MAGVMFGFNNYLYYLSSGTRASWGGNLTNGVLYGAAPGNLTVLSGVQDVKIGIDFDKAAASVRSGAGFKFTEPSLLDVPLTFKLLNLNYSETTQQFLIGQMIQRGVISIAALDGISTGNNSFGVWADYKVTKFEDGQPLAECDTYDVELSPCYTTVLPQFVYTG